MFFNKLTLFEQFGFDLSFGLHNKFKHFIIRPAWKHYSASIEFKQCDSSTPNINCLIKNASQHYFWSSVKSTNHIFCNSCFIYRYTTTKIAKFNLFCIFANHYIIWFHYISNISENLNTYNLRVLI